MKTNNKVLKDNFKLISKVNNNKLEISSPVQFPKFQSDKIYRTIFESSPDLIFTSRLSDGVIVDINKKLKPIFGYRASEMIGKTTKELNVFENYSRREELIDVVNQRGKATEFEVVLKAKSGKLINCQLFTQKVKLENELYLITIIRDVTIQKNAEEILRNHNIILEREVKERTKELAAANRIFKQNEVRLKEVEEVTSLGSWELNLQTNELKWSDEIFNIFEIDSKNFKATYKAFLELIHPDDREFVNNAYTKSVKTRIPYSIVHRLLFPDGKIKFGHEKCKTYYNKKGIATHSIGTVQDINEREQIRKQLIESEAKFRNLSNVTIEGIVVHEKGIPIEINSSFEKMFGYTIDEFSDKDAVELIFKKEFYNKIYENISKEKSSPVEAVGIKKDGTEFPVEFEGRSYYSKDNKLLRVAALRDITERKKAETDLKASKEFLEQLTNSLQDVVVSVKMPERVIEWVNNSINTIGYSSSECIGKKTDFLYADKAEFLDFGNKLKDVIASGKNILRKEILIKRKNGKTFPAEVIATINRKNNEVASVTSILRDITERKQAKQEIIETRNELSNAQQIAQLGSWELNLETQIITLSVEHQILINEKPERVSMHLFEYAEKYIVQEDIAVIQDRLDLAAQNIENIDYSDNFEYRLKTNEGEIRYFAIRGSFKSRGIILGVTQDMTIERLAEEKNQKLSAAIEQSPDSIAITNKEGDIEYVNPCFSELTGYSIEEAIGKNPGILGSDYHDDDFYKNMWETISSGKIWRGEFYNKKKNGELYWEDASISPIQNQNGEITSYVAVKKDITAQKTLFKQLEIHNKRLESLIRIQHNHFNSSNEMLDYTLTQALALTESKLGYIYYYSEEKKQFTLSSWSGEAMKQCAVTERQTVYDLDNTGCWGEAVRQRKPYFINDFSKSNKDIKGTPEGHVQLRKFLSVPVIVENKIKAVIGVANKESNYTEIDIKQLTLLMNTVWKNVEQKQYEKDLISAREKAEESDRLKTAFLSNMSHEIRTPMNGILGFAGLLKEPGLTGNKQQEYINIIEKSGNRMLKTIHDIIDISRIEAGQVDNTFSDININEIMQEFHLFFKLEADKKGIQLSFKNGLTSQEAIIISDRDKINSILTNLIKNAIKFSHKGEIEFGYNKNGNELDFYIKDMGIGIPENRLNAIFDRFVQADIEDVNVYEGSGLGLSISKAYVEMLGGKMWVESEDGVGSQFYFTIPYNTNKNKTSNSEVKVSGEIQEPQTKKLKVLIADDEEIAIMYLSIVVEEIAQEILVAKSGIETIELCKSNSDIDLILMDVRMPDISGYEATQRIREFNEDVIIIAQTAHAEFGEREKSLEAGCNDYITKPIRKDKLLKKIGNLVLKKFK